VVHISYGYKIQILSYEIAKVLIFIDKDFGWLSMYPHGIYADSNRDFSSRWKYVIVSLHVAIS